MHHIVEIKPLNDFILACRFSDGVIKNIDLKPILDKEAFILLRNENNFRKVVNRNYFVEWLGLDIDISADTLWHWGGYERRYVELCDLAVTLAAWENYYN